MEILEIFADEAGETHFRRAEIDLELRNFAPPSQPLNVSAEIPSTSSVFLVAPPGWDREFHPTPRRQLAVMLEGKATIRATDGETVDVSPGHVILLNDEASKGHLTQVQGVENAAFLLIGIQDSGL